MIGLNLTPEFHRELMEHDGSLVDFVEVSPDGFPLYGPAVLRVLHDYRARYPVVLHSTTLSLCGDGALPEALLTQVREVADATGADIYSDHFSFNDAGETTLDLYMAPLFTDEMVEWTVRRIQAVRARVGLPLAFENVGMLFDAPMNTLTEVEFLRRVLTDGGCTLQLNLDSVCISAATLGVDPRDHLRTFPLDLVSSITVVPESCMNPILRERYGHGIDPRMRELLDISLRHSPAERVCIQRRDGNSLPSLREDLEAAHALFRRHR